MKTISVHGKFRLALLVVLGFELIVHQSSAQSTENPVKATDVRQRAAHLEGGSSTNPIKQELSATSQREGRGLINDRNVDDKDDGTNRVSLTGSDGRKAIDITVVAGERKSNAVTIHNPGDSSVEWEVSLEGETGILYRIRRAGQQAFMCDKMEPSAETAGHASAFEKSAYPDVNGFGRGLDEASPVSLPMNADGFKDGNAIEHSLDVAESRRLTDDQVNSAIMADGKDPFQILLQWYHVLDCGYSRFAPAVDIVEISDDNGEHWRQILPMGDRPLVVNAKCLNPDRFVERWTLDEGKPDGYNVIFLDELLAEVRRRSAGLTVQPRAGIIAAHGSTEIELGCDTDALESDLHTSNIILKTKGSVSTEIVVPVRITVVPRFGNDLPTFTLMPEMEQIPQAYALYQNYPNPFNPTTTFAFDIPYSSFVILKVYNVLGQEVATAANETLPAGRYTRSFDAGRLASGVYFCRLVAGQYTETKRMMVLR